MSVDVDARLEDADGGGGALSSVIFQRAYGSFDAALASVKGEVEEGVQVEEWARRGRLTRNVTPPDEFPHTPLKSKVGVKSRSALQRILIAINSELYRCVSYSKMSRVSCITKRVRHQVARMRRGWADSTEYRRLRPTGGRKRGLGISWNQ